MRTSSSFACAAALALLTATAPLLVAQTPDLTPAPEAIAGKLADGSNFRVVKPDRWNGTLVLDLDFANNPSAPPSLIERWMTANGYAIGGISREPVAYRFPQAIDDLLDVRTRFIAKWGATPTRTLSMGNSRGAFVSRVAMERRPEIFAGALVSSGGGAGSVALHNNKLDALWTLKQLAGVPLKLVGFTNQEDAVAENGRIQAAVKELRATPLGRARLALAAAFEQFPTWTDGDRPPDPGDFDAQLDQVADAFAFANPAQVRYGVEVVAGGVYSWNHGVDYADLLTKSGMSPFVKALYSKSGADLEADLRTLAAAPRIGAVPAAVAKAEQTTTYTGKISGPVMNVDNIADPVDADAYKLAYQQLVTRAGKSELMRLAWVRSSRHSNQSALERLAGFTTLVERLDTGRWPDTSAEAMNARAQRLRSATSVDLGPSRFIAHTPPAPLRPWDGFSWGSYRRP
jgi:hypothetical protein